MPFDCTSLYRIYMDGNSNSHLFSSLCKVGPGKNVGSDLENLPRSIFLVHMKNLLLEKLNNHTYHTFFSLFTYYIADIFQYG